MVFPIISRGMIVRDDGLDASLSQFNSGTVTSALVTTDGDILDYVTTFTNPSAGDFAAAYRLTSATPSNTYPAWFIRYRFVTQPANYTVQAYFHFTNGSSQVNYGADNIGNTIVPNTNFQVGHYVAPANLNFDRMGIIITAQNGAVTASPEVQWDFVYICKEALTFPNVRQPIALRKRRNVIEIPILQREGGIQQDLGSMSADITVGGHLITTTAGQGGANNTYTADQWWYIFSGLVVESGIIAADGNPTWQWFQSDQIGAKVLVTDWLPQQPMGRVQFWDYAVQLKKFDIQGETPLKDLGPGPGGISY